MVCEVSFPNQRVKELCTVNGSKGALEVSLLRFQVPVRTSRAETLRADRVIASVIVVRRNSSCSAEQSRKSGPSGFGKAWTECSRVMPLARVINVDGSMLRCVSLCLVCFSC